MTPDTLLLKRLTHPRLRAVWWHVWHGLIGLPALVIAVWCLADQNYLPAMANLLVAVAVVLYVINLRQVWSNAWRIGQDDALRVLQVTAELSDTDQERATRVMFDTLLTDPPKPWEVPLKGHPGYEDLQDERP